MKIVKLEAVRKNEYEDFLKSQAGNTFLQSWAWGQWQEAQGKTVMRYFFVENENILGCAQMILMRTPLGNYLYCPYGPIWKTEVDEKTIAVCLEQLRDGVKKENNVFFLRIEPMRQLDLKKVGAVKAASVQPPQTLIKNIIGSEEELLKSFHHKTRYNIKVAERHGVAVNTFTEVNQDVIDLIMQTSERHDYRNYSADYIKKLWEFFSGLTKQNFSEIKVVGYLASKDKAPLAAGLMVDFAETRMYLFGGSNYAQRNFMGPYLMHWQAILDAKNSGLGFYDFGASENASGHSGGYMRFKMGFNPQIIDFSGTHDLVIKKRQYVLYSSLRKINRLILHLPFVK